MSEPTDPYSITTDVRSMGGDPSPSGAPGGASSAASPVAQSSSGAALAASPGPQSSLSSDSGSPVAEGEIIAGKYQVDRLLGRGGVGVVVAATHLRLKQQVAIKFLLPNASSEMIERFLQEAQSAVKLKSEHAAKVLDVGELPNGAPYMVMELLEGSDLADHLVFQGPLSVEEATEYVLQACEAMAEAHAAGIIHRDLKPANLFLTQTGGRKIVKVLDFGISKNLGDPSLGGSGMSLTKTSAVFGSPLYMPPEQMRSARDVDARSDIWSIGIILYELLTGRAPFDAELYPDLVVKITVEPAAPPSSIRRDIPAKLDAVVLRCLEKKQADRFQDVGKLASALAPFAPAHALISVDRIQKTLESASMSARGSALTGQRIAAQAKTDGSSRAATTRGSNALMWKAVALAVVGSTALVLGSAALLGVFKGPRDPQTPTAITPATESTGGPSAASAQGKAPIETPAGMTRVTPAGEASGQAQGGAAIASDHAGPARTKSSAAPQQGASSQPTSQSATSASPSQPPATAPETAVAQTAAAATQAPPPPVSTPPPATTKKSAFENMEIQ